MTRSARSPPASHCRRGPRRRRTAPPAPSAGRPSMVRISSREMLMRSPPACDLGDAANYHGSTSPTNFLNPARASIMCVADYVTDPATEMCVMSSSPVPFSTLSWPHAAVLATPPAVPLAYERASSAPADPFAASSAPLASSDSGAAHTVVCGALAFAPGCAVAEFSSSADVHRARSSVRCSVCGLPVSTSTAI